MLSSIRSQQNALRNMHVHPIFFFVFVYAFVIISLLLVYLAITNVWRWSLRILSIFFVFGLPAFLVGTFFTSGPFVVHYLSPIFVCLYILYIIFTCWVGLDLAIGLWRVAGTTEVSSFRATLDPRLTRGAWGLVNKILDLPRTPFRSWRTSVGYALSIVCAFVFAESLYSAVSFQNIINKVAILRATCTMQNINQCSDQSQSYAYEILLWLAISIAFIKFALTGQAWAKKMATLSVHEILEKPKEKYLFYLRSFQSDDITLPRPRLPLLSWLLAPLPFSALVEEELFDVADGYIPLIAVGSPGKSQDRVTGLAYREYLSDDAWRSYVEDKIKDAEKVILVLSTTEGVLWELNHLIALGAASKTLFFFDPRARDKETWVRVKEAIIPIFVRSGLMPPTFNFRSNAIAFYFAGGAVMEIENSHWSVSSYRTAFSFFLTETL